MYNAPYIFFQDTFQDLNGFLKYCMWLIWNKEELTIAQETIGF